MTEKTLKGRAEITPAHVHEVLGEHMLVDGFKMVIDLDKSHGVWLVDATSGRTFLDFYSFFASAPLGFNHPRVRTPEHQRKILRAATDNVTNSDLYTVEMAEFVETFARTAMPESLPHLFLVAGGTLGVENALKTAFDWKVQKNFAKGHDEGSRHAGDPLPAGVPRPLRLHALAHEHRSREDAVLRQVRLAAHHEPEGASSR